MQSSILFSIIPHKTPCLFTKKITHERDGFFCLSRKNLKMSVLARINILGSNYTRDITEGEKIGVPEENVSQVNTKYNKYQEGFT